MSEDTATRPASFRYVPPPVKWGIPTAILAILGFALIVLIANVVFAFVRIPAEWGGLIVWVVGYGVLLVGLALLTRYRGTGSWAKDFGLTFRWWDVLVGVGSGLVASVLASMIANPFVDLMGGGAAGV